MGSQKLALLLLHLRVAMITFKLVSCEVMSNMGVEVCQLKIIGYNLFMLNGGLHVTTLKIHNPNSSNIYSHY